jgi:hypothetical protein
MTYTKKQCFILMCRTILLNNERGGRGDILFKNYEVTKHLFTENRNHLIYLFYNHLKHNLNKNKKYFKSKKFIFQKNAF